MEEVETIILDNEVMVSGYKGSLQFFDIETRNLQSL